jgi:hypothetical protein
MKKRLLTALVVLTEIFLISASIVWAQPAPVARTGQTTCYADNNTLTDCTNLAAYGQDGDLQMGVPWPDPRFTDNGDGTVTDNLTGLMWSKDANLDNGTMTWNDAIDYANNLSLGSAGCGNNHTDWRLPNIKELLSMIDYGNYNFVLPSGHPFSNVQDGYYWSSTSSQQFEPPSDAFILRLEDGRVWDNGYKRTGLYRVWAVRGDTTSKESSYVGAYAAVPKTGQLESYREGDDGYHQMGVDWPDPRFTETGGGTVTDRLTGLMWTKDANVNGYIYWRPSMDYVAGLSLGADGCGDPSFNDWRLPNIKELLSIMDYGYYNPLLLSGHPFSNVSDYFFNPYWTSTHYLSNSGWATAYKHDVSIQNGKSSHQNRNSPRFTWAVRGGN